MQPQRLYHYTSIQTLARILHTRRLRFNRLDKVDDLQEAKSGDLGNLGRFYFLSCWSDSAEESIPLWSMYTPNMAGVRIGLSSSMFKMHTIQPQSDGFINISEEIESPLRLEDIFADRYTVCNTVNNPAMFLRRVEYTSDESRLHPTIRTRKGDWIVYGLGDFGTHKRPEWQFQSEWRFIITILPAPVRYPSLPQSQWSEEFERQMHKGITSGSLAFEDFYLDLNEEALNRIDIVLGPKCTKDEEVIVGSLLSKHCAGPSLRSSSLKGSIR